jgi:tetratricopeptide (TPR) repeat protein
MSLRVDLSAWLPLPLLALAAGGILADSGYLNAPDPESPLCRVRLCAIGEAITRAHSTAASPSRADVEAAEALFAETLRQDPSYPYRWCDLGESYVRTGKIDAARVCFRRAVALAPNSPPILIRAANFEFRVDNPSAAVPLTTRILSVISEYDSVIFLAYSRAGLATDFILRSALPPGPRAVTSYFEYLLARDSPAADRQVWTWMRDKDYAAIPLAAKYVRFLLAHARYDEALQAWSERLGRAAGDFPHRNRIFNAGFENEPTAALLDWAVNRSQGVAEDRDSSNAHSGAWSLRVAFDGQSNIRYQGASVSAIVDPGTYRLSAYIKTQEITTNQGIALWVRSLQSSGRVEVYTEALTGTNDWREVSASVVVPPGTRLLEIRPFRRPSEKIDNKIAGTAWIDSVELKPI